MFFSLPFFQVKKTSLRGPVANGRLRRTFWGPLMIWVVSHPLGFRPSGRKKGDFRECRGIDEKTPSSPAHFSLQMPTFTPYHDYQRFENRLHSPQHIQRRRTMPTANYEVQNRTQIMSFSLKFLLEFRTLQRVTMHWLLEVTGTVFIRSGALVRRASSYRFGTFSFFARLSGLATVENGLLVVLSFL